MSEPDVRRSIKIASLSPEAKAAGVEPRVHDLDGGDPVAYVLSANLHRRRLSAAQRAMIAVMMANLGEGRPKEITGARVVSQAQAAAPGEVAVSTQAGRAGDP